MSVSKSVRDHFEEVADCPGSVVGTAIKTTWTSGGVTQSKSTEQDPEQSTEDWKDDHKVDVILCMIGDPPDVDTDINTGRFDVNGSEVSITTTVEDCP